MMKDGGWSLETQIPLNNGSKKSFEKSMLSA